MIASWAAFTPRVVAAQRSTRLVPETRAFAAARLLLSPVGVNTLALLALFLLAGACSSGRAVAPSCGATVAELDTAMAFVLEETGLTEEQLDEELHRRGMSLEEYRSETKVQIERLKAERDPACRHD